MEWSSIDFGLTVWLGILLGGVANFAIGALWYALLFQKPWVAATGRTKEEFKAMGGPGAIMAWTLVGAVVSTAVIAVLYQWSGAQTLWHGLVVGLILGAGVSFWERLKPAVYNVDDRVDVWRMFWIDASYNVTGMAVGGLVYALVAG